MIYPITELIENYLSDERIINAGIKYCEDRYTCQECPLCDKVCIDFTGQICALYDSTTLADLDNLMNVLESEN